MQLVRCLFWVVSIKQLDRFSLNQIYSSYNVCFEFQTNDIYSYLDYSYYRVCLLLRTQYFKPRIPPSPRPVCHEVHQIWRCSKRYGVLSYGAFLTLNTSDFLNDESSCNLRQGQLLLCYKPLYCSLFLRSSIFCIYILAVFS